MSDTEHTNRLRRPSRRRDLGMTLPELLIAVAVLGLIMLVLAASIIVTLRQSDNTEGRINVARGEQSVDLYLPNDLASAETISQDPDASPCTGGCPASVQLYGSNALMLTWTLKVPNSSGTDAVVVTTNVSYFFRESSTPGIYQMDRIECTAPAGGDWTCEVLTVLHDIHLLVNWNPGEPVPPSIITVSDPLRPDAVDETGVITDLSQRKDANRVIVTINGGGDMDGAGGGTNRISITAGGTSRTTIPADSIMNAPTFTDARSRCGGPIALIVDDSGSIGSAMSTVEQGVKLFVQTFAGTPTQLQVVRFDETSGVVGGGGAWTKYFDMTDEAQVQQLLNAVEPELTADHSTNWEDAWFRAFYQQDGSDFLQTTPELVVFFTDGEPTMERLNKRAAGSSLIPNQPAPVGEWYQYSGGAYSNGSDYSQVAFDRANWVVNTVRASTRIIGVGVGSGITNGSSTFIFSPGRGWHWEYQRGSRTYQRAVWGFEQNTGWTSTVNFQKATTFSNNRDYESKVDFEYRTSSSGSWNDATPTQYFGASTSNRRLGSSTTRSWQDVTPDQYWTYKGSLGSSTYWRDNGTRSATTVSETLYDSRADANADDTTAGRADGWYVTGWTNTTPTDYYTHSTSPKWRISGTRTAYSTTQTEYNNYAGLQPANWTKVWTSISKTVYDANNTTADESDGYRRLAASWTWITKVEYDANNVPSASPADSDGYKDAGKQWVSQDSDAMEWEPYNTTSTAGGYRRIQSYTAPYDQHDDEVTQTMSNADILARLVKGNDDAPVSWDGQVPGNAKVADMFVLPDFTKFAAALQSVALAECGGTVTLQTKVGGVRAADPVTYQNSKVFSSSGTDLQVLPTVVTTSKSFPTGTFDFEIPDGGYVTVELMPNNLSDLTAYHLVGWECKAGITPITDLEFPPVVDVNGVAYPGWTGVRVKVRANQAVSCAMDVAR
jgi:prepilin-type N-terminal cleavage/methylation domain-containing protein